MVSEPRVCGVSVMGRLSVGSGDDDGRASGEGGRLSLLLITAAAMMLPTKSLTHWASVRWLDCSTRDMSTEVGA